MLSRLDQHGFLQPRPEITRLRTAVRLLKFQQDSIPDAIVTVDGRGRVLYQNSRLHQLLSDRGEEASIVGEDDLLLTLRNVAASPEDLEDAVDYLRSRSSGGTGERTVALADGRFISLCMTRLREEAGNEIGRAWSLRDVTAHREAETLRSALFRIAEVSRAARDLNELYALIHGIVGELMDATNFYIALLDQKTNTLSFPYFVDQLDTKPIGPTPVTGLTGWVLRSREALLATPETFAQLCEQGEVSDVGAPSVDWLGVPLLSQDQAFGVLGVQSYDPGIRYGEKEKEILQFVSQHVASAIEHKIKEDRILDSEIRHRQMFQNNRAIKLVIDPADGAIVDANPAACEFYGYAEPELLRLKIFDLNVKDRTQIVSSMQRAVQEGGYFVFQHRIASGEVRDVEVYSGPLDIRGRKLLYSIIHDITERRRIEQTMRFQTAAMEAAMDGIAILDRDGRFTYVNQAFIRLFGFRGPSSLIGEEWKRIIDPAEIERFTTDVRRTLRDQHHWRGEATGIRRDGSSFPQEISLTLMDHGSAICVARDVTERMTAEDQIKHLAYHDALTSLPNRLLFKDRLAVAISRALRDSSSLAVVFFDLDNFKNINDSLGHNAGDQLLQVIASRILSCVRDSDTVARLGGDEFILLLPSLRNAQDAAQIVTKILSAIRQPVVVEGSTFYVTSSAGISVFPLDGDTADMLIKNADTAMYQAKEVGRDNVQLYNRDVNERSIHRLTIESGLRRAIQEKEFELHYQPILDLGNGRIHGMEALVRWRHPTEGLIAPGEFIGIAEASGLMVPIGAMVLEEACRQHAEWQQRGFRGLTLAVNIAVCQLQQPTLVDTIRHALLANGLKPSQLELEITESSAMQNPEVSIATLDGLKKLGVRISLDDFGIGHSSLSYLKRFPIDTLKIDRSFIHDLIVDPDTAAIVTAIIAMGHKLRLDVVAEGVEHESQRAFLVENLCDRMQGFLYHRPVNAAAFEELLIVHNRGAQQWQVPQTG